MMRKGGSEVTDMLLVIAIGVSLITFFVFILPTFINAMYKTTALQSADAVSRDLAGLITISAAAPDRIKIKYQTSSLYDVGISDRIVQVKHLEGMKDTALARTAIQPSCSASDNPQCQFTDVGRFEIDKSAAGQQIDIEVSAYEK